MIPLLDRLSAVTVVLVAVTAFPLAAAADSDDDAYDEMLQLSNVAADAVGEGNFEVGAVKFRQAYETYADPVLLNNEMIAWYRAGDCQNALVPATTFTEVYEQEGDGDELDEADRRNVRTVLTKCHLQLAEDALAADNPILADYHLEAVPPSAQRDDEDEQLYRTLVEQLEEHPDFAPPEPPPEPEPVVAPEPSGGHHLGWSQIAAGIALGGVGLSMHAVALTRQAQLDDLAVENSELFERRRSDWADFQNAARWAVPTLYVLGAAAIGSGTYFLLRSDAPSDSVAIAPTVGPDRTGVTVTGRF